MSVYKDKRSLFYLFDFQISNRRFHGSTKCTNRKDAERFESLKREDAKALVKAMSRAKISMLINDVADRLWNDSARYDADPNATETNLARLIEYFGERMPLTQIDHAKAKEMVAWRRGNRVSRRGKRNRTEMEALPYITNATVNRSATKVLQRLFTFAKSEGAIFEREPKWHDLLLPEPAERVRELQEGEAAAFDHVTRADYEPFFAFARSTGMRLKECVTLRWAEVNFGTRQIVRTGKGGRRVVFPITDSIREILFPLQGHHVDRVFTYIAVYGNRRLGILRGARYPISYTGAKSAWQRLRANAGVADFRFHDFRHDVGTKVLRETGNLKLAQKVLNHADIKSTLRYAHVLDEDVADAVERVAMSREKSRSRPRKAS
jgi:integrase